MEGPRVLEAQQRQEIAMRTSNVIIIFSFSISVNIIILLKVISVKNK